MGSDSNDKIIGHMFTRESRNLMGDKDLKNNAILNSFRSEHGKIMNEHATQYTNLLKRYIKNSETSATQKKWFKNIFFVVAMLMLISSFILFALISLSFSMKEWENIETTALTGLISALLGLLSLYIVIPEIIAKYLFNEKEDDNMTKIIESIQNYDEKVFNSMNAYSFGENIEQEGGGNTMLKLKKEAERENKDGDDGNDGNGGNDNNDSNGGNGGNDSNDGNDNNGGETNEN